MRFLFGEIGLELGYLKPTDIDKCVDIQKKTIGYKPLGQIAAEKGFMTPDELERCIELQKDEMKQKSIGQIAIELGYLREEEMDVCAEAQWKTFNPKSIGQIFIEEGLLDSKQVGKIIARLEKDQKAAASKPAVAAPAAKASTGMKKVLVADDSPTIRQFTKVALKDEFDVTAVATGEEAVEAANETMFDLIILDIELPGIDGFEVAVQTRQINGYEQTPLLFFSMRSGPEIEAQVKGVGGLGLWEKPDFKNLDKLRKKVRNCLNFVAGLYS